MAQSRKEALMNIKAEKKTAYDAALNNPKFNIGSRHMFGILLMLIWIKNTLWPFARIIINKLPIINVISEYAFPILTVIAVFFSVPYMMEHIKAKDLMFVVVCIGAVVLPMFVLHENAEFIKEDLQRILLTVIPMFLVGVCYSHEKYKRVLYYCSAVNILVSFAYQLYKASTATESMDYNMNAAYNILPSIMFLMLWAFNNGKLRNWILIAMGMLVLLSHGTRGPVLATVLFFAVMLILHKTKSNLTKALKYAFFLIGGVILASGTLLTVFSENMQKLFEELGMSTRIFDFFLEGELTQDSGRSFISKKVWSAISEHPIAGNGIMGDRVALDGMYAHNIFLEVWCQLGLVLGTILIGAIITLAVYALIKARKTEAFGFVLMLVILVFTKLMVSSSYLIEPLFFLMIGVCIKAIRDAKAERELEAV